MYQIYKVTAPSGKSYIGLTKQGVMVRWNNHVRKAYKRVDYNHGLYNAIRKYGPSAFTLAVLADAKSKQEAQRLEKKYIAATDKTMLYNVSPGGEADGSSGSALFWRNINADPNARAAYLEKLSRTKRSRDWTDYAAMTVATLQWRKDNPKAAHKLSRRASRVASRTASPKRADTRTLKERLMWKHKRGDMVSAQMTAFWAKVSQEKKLSMAQKVSVSAKARWDAIQDKYERAKITEKARAGIDRDKQGKAASEGIKRWWVELKANPVRYAEYIERRAAALVKTLEGKK